MNPIHIWAAALAIVLAVVFQTHHIDKRFDAADKRLDDFRSAVDKRLDDFKSAIDKRFDDLKDWIKAEIKALEGARK
jgi:hypothetical protein